MLYRSGLSFRKILAHRRPSEEDINGAELMREGSPTPVPFGASGIDQDDGSISYGGSKRPHLRRRAPSPIIATGPLTHTDILRPLPPLPSETPRSRADSSIRCERHTECDCPLVNRKRRSGLYSIPQRQGSVDSTLVACVDTSNPDDSLTQRVPKSRFYLSNGHQFQREAIPALLSEEEYKEEWSKEQYRGNDLTQELSEDVQQFMQEAEDAFKAIGGTFSETNLEQSTFSDVTKPSPLETPRDSDSKPPTPPPKRTSPESPPRSPSRIASSPTTIPNEKPKVTLPTSNPRRRKSKSRKTRPSMKSQRRPTALKQAVKSGTKRTLTENVSELLTGKLFHKIEADEMLTPDQIEMYKQRRIRKRDAEEKAEASDDSSSSNTPIEAMHPIDIPLRVDSVGAAKDMSAHLSVGSSSDLEHDFSIEGHLDIPNDKTITALAPRPLKLAGRKGTMDLPVITESRPSSRLDDGLPSHNNSDDDFRNSANDEYVFLQSPPCSMMTPNFRHGPIRLSRADLMPDMRLGADDVLDWTAFQMAILGGAGDWLTDNDDTQNRDEEEIDEIIEWWESWHFVSPSPTSTLSSDEIPDLAYSEIESENASPDFVWSGSQQEMLSPTATATPTATPMATPNLRLNLNFVRAAMRSSSSTYFGGPQTGMDSAYPWRRESMPKQSVAAALAAANRESVASLPPSPMLDLRVTRSTTGDLDVVPMGYNLGHDLGDFLRWEAEHAYGGFTSPGGMVN